MTNVLIVVLSTFLFTSCGMFHKPSPQEEVWKKLNVDSIHFKSCGPVALEKLHKHFGENVDNRMVSIYLQEKRKIKIFRLLGLIDTEFRQITCPPELLKYLRTHNFNYEKIKYCDLKDGDVAIILLKGYDDLYEWHWSIWPHDAESIPTFFKEHTQIIRTYKITKKFDK